MSMSSCVFGSGANGSDRRTMRSAAASSMGIWLAKATARIRERAGFHFRPHDLRRTAASGMAALGVDRETLGKVLGHKSADAGVIGIYDRYGREPEKRAALEAWGTYLADVVAGKAGRTEVERAS